jgi:hypothetical protein
LVVWCSLFDAAKRGAQRVDVAALTVATTIAAATAT